MLRRDLGEPLPPREILVAVEGWGKSSYGAHAPGAVMLMAKGETGYLTLAHHGLAPTIPNVTLDSWAGTLALIDSLIADPQGCKTVVLDALRGFERLCHEEVCRREFNGEWSEKGFTAFQRGYDVSVSEWTKLLARLDQLHQQHRVGVILLSHVSVRTHKNPDGADYDRYQSDAHPKTWAPTAGWADMVIFGNYVTDTGDRSDKKAKAKGGTQRVAYFERRASFDAKNRYGLPESMTIECGAAEMYAAVHSQIERKP